MTEYIQLTRRGQIMRQRRLAKNALGRYGIEPAKLSLLSHYYNTTFKVTTPEGEDFVLRIPRGGKSPLEMNRRGSSLESELWWLDRLKSDLDLQVPEAVPALDGAKVVSVGAKGIPEDRPCVLFRWIDGRFLDDRLMPRHLEQVGRLTARLHQHSSHLAVPPNFHRDRAYRTDLELEEYVVRLFTDHFSVHAGRVMQEVFRRTRIVEGNLGGDPDAFGLIHADIHQRNYLFNGGELRLIDFDDSGWGHYLYDLAITLNETSSISRYPQLRAALLAGYRQVRPLSPQQEATIDTFIMLRQVQDITWFPEERENAAFSTPAPDIADRIATIERLLARVQ